MNISWLIRRWIHQRMRSYTSPAQAPTSGQTTVGVCPRANRLSLSRQIVQPVYGWEELAFRDYNELSVCARKHWHLDNSREGHNCTDGNKRSTLAGVCNKGRQHWMSSKLKRRSWKHLQMRWDTHCCHTYSSESTRTGFGIFPKTQSLSKYLKVRRAKSPWSLWKNCSHFEKNQFISKFSTRSDPCETSTSRFLLQNVFFSKSKCHVWSAW